MCATPCCRSRPCNVASTAARVIRYEAQVQWSVLVSEEADTRRPKSSAICPADEAPTAKRKMACTSGTYAQSACRWSLWCAAHSLLFFLSLFLSYSRRCAPCCCFCRTGLCARVLWWWRKLHQKQKEDASLFWDFGVIFVCDLICDFRDATKKNKTWCPLIIYITNTKI